MLGINTWLNKKIFASFNSIFRNTAARLLLAFAVMRETVTEERLLLDWAKTITIKMRVNENKVSKMNAGKSLGKVKFGK